MSTFVDRIFADKWNGVLCEEEEIRAPSRADFDRLIDALDARTRTIVSLDGHDGSSLTIGGGAGQYVVYASTSDEQLWNLLADDFDPEGIVFINAGGQVGDFPARQVVDKCRTLKAGHTFLLTGQLESALPWEKQA